MDASAPTPLTGSGLTNMPEELSEAAGIPSDRITGHSLRAGLATTAAVAGVERARIAAQTRHGRISTLVEHYIRPLEALRVTSSRHLGL
jgi:integrase